MDGWIQILVSGLTVGAMYAVSTISLSLVWGALNVLNMGQGAMLAAGGYIAYTAVMSLNLPIPIAIVVAVIVVDANATLAREAAQLLRLSYHSALQRACR